MKTTRSFALATTLVALLAPACVATTDDATPSGAREDVASATASLNAFSSLIWKQRAIGVCWENPSSADAAARGWAQDAVEQTWMKASLVRFNGWGACGPNDRGVRIRIDDVLPSSSIGTQLDGMRNGMTLNLTFNAFNPGCPVKEQCVRMYAVHEFGHALGFGHESDRSDAPPCPVPTDGNGAGDTRVGKYDPQSIMNYCATDPWKGIFLSAGDIAGVKQYYGAYEFGATAKDVLVVGAKVYLFNGAQYTRWDRTTGRIADLYPRDIYSQYASWPVQWKYVDAAVNWGDGTGAFFHDNMFVKYDVVNDRISSSPTPIVGNFANWPGTWSNVDAIVLSRKPGETGKAVFFRGDEWITVGVANHAVDGPPQKISARWNLPSNFRSGFEYVLDGGDGLYYFVRGHQFISYDPVNEVAVGSGDLQGSWAGVPYGMIADTFGTGGVGSNGYDYCAGAAIMCNVHRSSEYATLASQCLQLGGRVSPCTFGVGTNGYDYCAGAAMMCSIGRQPEWNTLAAQCVALGGQLPACQFPPPPPPPIHLHPLPLPQ